MEFNKLSSTADLRKAGDKFDGLFKAVESLPEGTLAQRARPIALAAKRAYERGGDGDPEYQKCLSDLGSIAIQSEGFAAVVKIHKRVDGSDPHLAKIAGRR